MLVVWLAAVRRRSWGQKSMPLAFRMRANAFWIVVRGLSVCALGNTQDDFPVLQRRLPRILAAGLLNGTR